MDNKNFKPYVPPEKITPEITVSSVSVGLLLAVIFGAANAYLGLRVGMTVSASIPAAVIAMGVIRGILKKDSILESNIVQTTGSAGESVAAGAIFTLPALFLWAAEGKMNFPSPGEITFIAMFGGLLGVFFMIPLRNALIVQEHGILPYPEGTACAEVLLAGEKENTDTPAVFYGMGISALFKFLIDGLKIASSEISVKINSFAIYAGTQIYPAVLSVGYICGAKISSFMFAGGVMSWLVLIPLTVLFGSETILYPMTETVGEIFKSGGASAIWSGYIRYIGAGALAAGGIISLLKSIPIIFKTFSDSIRNLRVHKNNDSVRTSREIGIKAVLIAIFIITILIWLSPAVPVPFLGAALIVIFGFFFATVSSRMVGLVGSSNNPVSGMAIATLLISTLILKFTGSFGAKAMESAIAIGSVICIISAIAGDTSQDLKTGYILGATPKKQQICEILGVITAAIAISGTLYLLNMAWGFGSEELAAPQATLMKIIVEGVMEGNLPWGLVISGVFLAVVAEILKIPPLPFAIGIYLPLNLSACIMAGGVIRYFMERKKDNEKAVSRGTLFCSGLIAGEGLMGIILAILAIVNVNLSVYVFPIFSLINAVIIFGAVIFSVIFFSHMKGHRNAK